MSLIRLPPAETCGQAALGVGIDEQHFSPVPGKADTEIGGGGHLADPAFLIAIAITFVAIVSPPEIKIGRSTKGTP